MGFNKLAAFSLSALIYVANVTIMSTAITGCTDIFPSKTLSQAKAERIIKKWMGSKGTIKEIKGVVQNDNESMAVANLDIAEFNFTADGITRNYSGAAVASFTRYTDGTWAMTKFTVTPPNILGTVWFDVNVKE